MTGPSRESSYSSFTLCLFDQLRFEENGQLVTTFSARKQDLLLACAGIAPRGRRLSRDGLTRALWSPKSDNSGKNRLSEVLTRLRDQLRESGIPENAIEADRYEVGLNPALPVDRDLFAAAIVDADGIDDPFKRMPFLGRAVILYGGGLAPLMLDRVTVEMTSTLHIDPILATHEGLDASFKRAKNILVEDLRTIGEREASHAVLTGVGARGHLEKLLGSFR